MESHGEFSIFEHNLLESKCDVLKVIIELALVGGSLEESKCLCLQLVHLASEAPIHLQFVTIEVHLSQGQRHTLQVQLCLLLFANLVLEVSQLLAVADLFLLHREESNKQESACHAKAEEDTQWHEC